MSLSNTNPVPNKVLPNETRVEERESIYSEATTERQHLSEDFLNQWSDVPPEAIKFLATECKTPAQLELAIAEVRVLLADDPEILASNSEILLSYCVNKAEDATFYTKEQNLDVEKAAINDRNKTHDETTASIESENAGVEQNIAVLREAITGNLSGANKKEQLLALIAEVKTSFIGEELEIALENLESIRTKLAEFETLSTSITNPEERTEFQNILGTSTLNLGATTSFEVFGDVITQVYESENISETTKQKAYELFGITKEHITTGRDVQRSLSKTQINPETGEEESVYSKDHPLFYRPGLAGYREGSRNQIRAETRDGRVMPPIDVTGWSAAAIGVLSEALQLWVITEEAGISDFMETAYGIDLRFSSGFDPLKLIETRQIIDALLGGNEGYDGKILDGQNEGKFLSWQMQYFSSIGDAGADNVDIKRATKSLQTLGIKNQKGQLDLEILKAFGHFSREQYATGAPDLDLL